MRVKSRYWSTRQVPAHESLSPQFGQSSRDAQRRERLLSKSQAMLDDIDHTVDNKPYQPTEVEKAAEARSTKQWGPDPDPVNADHPTIFRFEGGFEPHMGGNYYRTPEEEGNGHGGYLTENTDQLNGSRVNMFGQSNFTPYRKNELHIDEDGPLHGVARPLQDPLMSNSSESGWTHSDRRAKDAMYMSKEEKLKARGNNAST